VSGGREKNRRSSSEEFRGVSTPHEVPEVLAFLYQTRNVRGRPFGALQRRLYTSLRLFSYLPNVEGGAFCEVSA
jgi:hypothetical protein